MACIAYDEYCLKQFFFLCFVVVVVVVGVLDGIRSFLFPNVRVCILSSFSCCGDENILKNTNAVLFLCSVIPPYYSVIPLYYSVIPLHYSVIPLFEN